MIRLLVTAWLVTGALYATMLVWSLPHLTGLAGGMAMFDMRPGGYSHAEAEALVSALGEVGRDFYLSVQHRLDTLFPAFEALALSLAFFHLYSRRLAASLSLVAWTAAVFDWLENAAVAAILRADASGLTPDLVAMASRWSVLKAGAVTLAMTALLIGLGLTLWRRLRAA